MKPAQPVFPCYLGITYLSSWPVSALWSESWANRAAPSTVLVEDMSQGPKTPLRKGNPALHKAE